MRKLSPSFPLRSEAEKNALLDSIERLNDFQDSYYSLRLISPQKMISNVTSQFRLQIMDENMGRVEVRRSGRGWGRDVTVAVVLFVEEPDFELFLELKSFSDVKRYLAERIHQQREVVFRGDSHQVP